MGQGELQHAIRLQAKMTLTSCRMPIRLFLGEFRTSAVSSSPSVPPSLLALHTLIFQRDPSYPRSHPYQASSANGLLNPSSCKEGNCRHGQYHHCNGLGTLNVSFPSTVPQTGTTLSLDPLTSQYESGMLRLVLQSAAHSRVTLTM